MDFFDEINDSMIANAFKQPVCVCVTLVYCD